MNRATLLSLIALATALISTAGNAKDDVFEFSHNRIAFNGLLTSSDSYTLEATYHYMFNHYISAGGGIGYWQVYYEDGRASGNGWEIDSDDNKPSNLYLRPSLVLKSPAIRIKSVNIGLFAEPGLMMGIPYKRVCINRIQNWTVSGYDYISTGKGQWLSFDLRAGVYANAGPCGFSIGYMMSNLDVYSQYRKLSYDGHTFGEFYPKRPFMQGAYLALSYYF
ncbi:MAG: hypothetical protein JFR38_08205 [Muribaculaceae bacterium]|nr:hypothetical protein [Muribaculaceae bacterium]